MDGPNVNWKVFEDLQSEIQLENGKNLLNVGSCGLHVIHGAFRSAMSETGWDIETLLISAYRLFKDSRAKRGFLQYINKSFSLYSKDFWRSFLT